MPVSEVMRYEKSTKQILGKDMAYVDDGEGDPIVFLHGNPTSSYLWRNIMPHLEGKGRLIAPDMIGMGDSTKLENSGPDRYRFTEHRDYLFALLEALDVEKNVTLVIHDWGSAMGFHWARTYPQAVKGIAFMEAIVAPIPDWDSFPATARQAFEGLRSPAGEEMVLDNNIFVEQILPGAILRELSESERAEYRRPFAEPGEARRPTLTWPREIPLAGEPADVVALVEDYADWLAGSTIPKLFINAEPGSLIQDEARELVRSWPNVSEVTVAGLHFVQEDSPDQIGKAIAAWIDEI